VDSPKPTRSSRSEYEKNWTTTIRRSQIGRSDKVGISPSRTVEIYARNRRRVPRLTHRSVLSIRNGNVTHPNGYETQMSDNAHGVIQVFEDGSELTADDLEPGLGTIVEDSIGDQWVRHTEVGWVNPVSGAGPASWTTVAGDFGPVIVVAVSEAE
jgi:hypothetical protein